jgi:hypothetical protein
LRNRDADLAVDILSLAAEIVMRLYVELEDQASLITLRGHLPFPWDLPELPAVHTLWERHDLSHTTRRHSFPATWPTVMFYSIPLPATLPTQRRNKPRDHELIPLTATIVTNMPLRIRFRFCAFACSALQVRVVGYFFGHAIDGLHEG